VQLLVIVGTMRLLIVHDVGVWGSREVRVNKWRCYLYILWL
jgi:hypothetical protein